MAYGVGATLRHERVRRSVALKEISLQTKISERFLNAIEEEDFDQLPGMIFTRNFVRQYALALDLDSDALLVQLPRVDIADAPLPMAPERSRTSHWDPRWNSAISYVTWLALAAGACVAAYMHYNRPAAARIETSPALVAAATPAPTPIVAPTAAPAPTSTEPVPPAAAASGGHPVQVVLTAKEQSWVQVSADGKVAFTATLQPNETRSIAADDQVRVVTGNAGGILISLNGKSLDPLGPSGQVRTVKLTAEGSQLVLKTPPQQPPPDPL